MANLLQLTLLSAITLIAAAPTYAAAPDLPFTGTWVTRGTIGQIYELDVRNGTYSCPQCDGNGGPYTAVPIDGAEHKAINPPGTVRIRAVGPFGFEVVRKGEGTGTTRAIRTVSPDGRKFEELAVTEAANGEVTWTVRRRERVGQPVAKAHLISGRWKEVAMERSLNNPAPPPMTYTQTADRFTATAGPEHYDARFDGKEYPLIGGTIKQTVTLRRLDDHTVEEIWKENGVEVDRLRMVVSADGKTLTSTAYRNGKRIGTSIIADRK